MLEGHVLPSSDEAARDSIPYTIVGETPHTPGRCLLLELPTELRSQIFKYVLPYTVYYAGNGICWIGGTTTLLAVSNSVHDEAAHIMYSQAIFVLYVLWDCTVFRCQNFLASGVLSHRLYAFPGKIGSKYLQLLRSVEVDVEIPDHRTRLVKHGLSSVARLKQGLGDQMESLCNILRGVPNLQRLCVHYSDQGRRFSTDLENSTFRDILGPILEAFPDVTVDFDEIASNCTHHRAPHNPTHIGSTNYDSDVQEEDAQS